MATPTTERKTDVAEEESGKVDHDSTEPEPHESPKRKSETANADAESSGKKKRRKVNHACVYCRRSHMTCDLERPCARCVKRDIGHLCHDEPRDPPKRSKSDIGVAEIAPAPEESKANESMGTYGMTRNGAYGHAEGTQNGTTRPPPPLVQPQSLSPAQLQRPTSMSSGNATSTILQNLDWNNHGVHNQFQDMHHLHPNYMFNTSEVTNEYNLLNDFLTTSLLDDAAMYGGEDAPVLFNDPMLSGNTAPTISNGFDAQPSTTQAAAQSLNVQPTQQMNAQDISRPSSSMAHLSEAKARDKFYMTAADPAGFSSAEDRLHKLLRAKYDAGILKPFNYVKGYARLNAYMSRHLSRDSQLRVLKQLERFRPKFREAMQSLTDMQLVLVEMWFERSLMEYDRVFASMAIPACCWRRTGEIFRGNREMAELIGVSTERLRDGRLAIHEIIAEDSLVSYWEKFGAIAFDQNQKAILTSCVLQSPQSTTESVEGKEDTITHKERRIEAVRCCFSFTIRRDTHNIPSLIVGNFLPIRPRNQNRDK